MKDKKTAQYEQLIDDLRETRRVIGDAKMKLHDLIDRIDTAHDVGLMPDGVYEQMDTLIVLYDNARLSRVALNQCIDALQEDLQDVKSDEKDCRQIRVGQILNSDDYVIVDSRLYELTTENPDEEANHE